jgi:hypothetical protein
MSLKKIEYIYLLNTLNNKGIINYEQFNNDDNVNDMKRIFRETLSNLNFQSDKRNYQQLKQYIDSFPNQNINEINENIPNQNIQENEENIPINENFNNNENMVENQQPLNRNLYQNLDQNLVDPSMKALLDLISKQHKEIPKMEKLMTPQRAQEFIHKQN